MDALLRTGATEGENEKKFPIEGEKNRWWGEVFVHGQLLPFASLFVDGLPEDEIPRLLYRVRNFFHASQEIHPAFDDLRPEHPALLPYAERQWFLFSLDGGAFVACDAPNTDFFRQTLPDHLGRQYFLLFLLVLHQRFALMMLSEEVAKHWLVGGDKRSDEEREVVFERIRDALLSFTARGYFAQVMQREHHHRCYRKWQETFQVDRLYQEVSDEVRDMHDYLMMRRTEHLQQLAEEERKQREEEERAAQERARRLEKRISLLGACIGIPALIISFLSINLYDITAKGEGLPFWPALLIVITLSVLLGGPVLWLLMRKLRKEDKGRKKKKK